MAYIGLTYDELRTLIANTLAEKTIEIDTDAPPHIDDVYAWIEQMLGHHSRLWMEVLLKVLHENNKRIRHQIGS